MEPHDADAGPGCSEPMLATKVATQSRLREETWGFVIVGSVRSSE